MFSASYSPLNDVTADPRPQYFTLWDLAKSAAQAKYGTNIDELKTPSSRKKLYALQFDICIVSADPEPVEVKRMAVDIITKEYINRGQNEIDKTVVIAERTNPDWARIRYHFTRKGVICGIGGDIGPQVRRLAVTGGTTRIKIADNVESELIGRLAILGGMPATVLETEKNFLFNYKNEENITVPPMSRVKAKIVSHSVTHWQGFVIKFMIPSSVSVPVDYRIHHRTGLSSVLCASLPCSLSYETASVGTAQLFRDLPDYREENGVVSFVQHGVLSWIGEGSIVEKQVEPLE